MADDYIPRLSIDLRPDQAEVLSRILPHGTKKLIFHALIDSIISVYDKKGFEGLAPILTGHIDAVTLARHGVSYTQSAVGNE